MTRRATTADELTIAYDDRGVGEPALICLPGWCSDRSQFAPLIDRLAASRRTIVLDWRGHGDSDTPDGDYGYAEMREDLVAVINDAGVERVVPVAAAHAGWAALDLRRRLQERVVGIAAISWMVMGAPPPFIAGLQRMQEPDGWDQVRDQLFVMWRGGGDHRGVEEQIARMRAFGSETWMRAGREIESAYRANGSPVEVLSTFDPPTPFLHVYAQPNDPQIFEAQMNFAEKHPWFMVHRVDAKSHFPQFEVADEVAQTIEEFAAKL